MARHRGALRANPAATPMPVVLKRGTGQLLIKDKDLLDLDRDITGARGRSGQRFLG